MRASETASDASPGTTASQTGVPTQVVQQTQGTPQVGTGHHAPALPAPSCHSDQLFPLSGSWSRQAHRPSRAMCPRYSSPASQCPSR